jgi:mono/diheme cytochrome c family protein
MVLAAFAAVTGAAFVGACAQNSGGGVGIVDPPSTQGPEPIPFQPQSSPPGPRPQYGPTVTQAHVPPPISGGTLLVTKDGNAFAADPDRDQVYIVDLSSRAVTTIALSQGDEPGRAVEDANGRVHVALRSGGGVVTVDLASKTVVDRTATCALPRGVAYDALSDNVLVACKSGELVILPAAGGPQQTVSVERDLRDVVIDGDTVYVSSFRTAQVLSMTREALYDASGKALVPGRFAPPASAEGADATVAWRMIARPGGGVTMLHQRGQAATAPPISTGPGGYSQGGGGDPGPEPCDRAIVEGALTSFGGPDAVTTTSAALSDAVVPVDVAISPGNSTKVGGSLVAVVAAGNAHTKELPQILVFDTIQASIPPSIDGGVGDPPPPPPGCISSQGVPQPSGEATAVAFTRTGDLLVQTREPATIFIATQSGPPIKLSNVSREDTGHAIFHANSGGFIACASCHAEGQDDSRVWNFDNVGPRRTPSLLGTVEGTAPYHWGGEEKDFGLLVHDVFTGRMSGAPLEGDQLTAASRWVNALPAPPAPAAADAAAVSRGQALFQGAAGCTGCHVGAKHTNNATVNVGTGGSFQVPPLVGVGYRAPFLHMGCAQTLQERFSCGGGSMHGNTSGLTQAQIGDLVAFLDTL